LLLRIEVSLCVLSVAAFTFVLTWQNWFSAWLIQIAWSAFRNCFADQSAHLLHHHLISLLPCENTVWFNDTYHGAGLLGIIHTYICWQIGTYA